MTSVSITAKIIIYSTKFYIIEIEFNYYKNLLDICSTLGLEFSATTSFGSKPSRLYS